MAEDATNVWDEVPDWGGIGARRVVRPEGTALGCDLGAPARRLAVRLRFHHGDEELLIVLRGKA